MSYLCAVKFSALAVLYVLTTAIVWMIAWGLGRRSAIRRHWKMLKRVGSRFAGEDN